MEQENREVVYKTNISVTAIKQWMLAVLIQDRYCTLQQPNFGIPRPRVLAITSNLYKAVQLHTTQRPHCISGTYQWASL
jgi:hypothetical protein